MKAIWNFISLTVKGGITFFLPIIFLIIGIEKGIGLITNLVQPLAEQFGIHKFAGKATIALLVGIIIVVICFLGGLLMRFIFFKELHHKLDKFLSKFIPQYGDFKKAAPKHPTASKDASL